MQTHLTLQNSLLKKKVYLLEYHQKLPFFQLSDIHDTYIRSYKNMI